MHKRMGNFHYIKDQRSYFARVISPLPGEIVDSENGDNSFVIFCHLHSDIRPVVHRDNFSILVPTKYLFSRQLLVLVIITCFVLSKLFSFHFLILAEQVSLLLGAFGLREEMKQVNRRIMLFKAFIRYHHISPAANCRRTYPTSKPLSNSISTLNCQLESLELGLWNCVEAWTRCSLWLVKVRGWHFEQNSLNWF